MRDWAARAAAEFRAVELTVTGPGGTDEYERWGWCRDCHRTRWWTEEPPGQQWCREVERVVSGPRVDRFVACLQPRCGGRRQLAVWSLMAYLWNVTCLAEEARLAYPVSNDGHVVWTPARFRC